MSAGRSKGAGRAAGRFERWDMDAERLAVALLGQVLVRVHGGRRMAGVIVETEAYLGGDDLGSHSAGGRRTPRNESMFLAGGHAYVYFIYGMHHCFNIVAGPEGTGCAVLVRAVEPVEGMTLMAKRLRSATPAASAGSAADPRSPLTGEMLRRLGAGPARLCRAMSIDRALDREWLPDSRRLFVERGSAPDRRGIVVGPRIGLGAVGVWARAPLRFGLRGSPFLSRPFPRSTRR